jgi:hypothetical protein
MQMEAAGDRRPRIRSGARAERKALATEARREQVFSILWDRHGTGDDEDRELAWTWFNLWPRVAVGLHHVAGSGDLSPVRVADFVDESA